MSTFLLDGYELDSTADESQDLLGKAHASRTRLLCMCTRPPQEMYVAKVGQRYYVKRMPNTGSRHAPGCDSYEPPAELSGLGDLIGGAITEDVSDGSTTLRLGFSLSKAGGRAAPVSSGAESDTVKTDGKKLTLRATLHYLWDQAGFNRWSPAMTGKRSWGVVHRYLIHAAEGKTAKGDALAEALFVAEPFHLQDKDGIERRRLAKIAPLRVQAKGTKRLMIVVGEIKAIEPSRYGHKIVVKHLADMPFMVNDDLHKRMTKRFADELELWNSIESTHLVMVGTFGLGPTGVASLEELALMVATQEWLPIENVFEMDLLGALVAQQRHFIKGMRYNLAGARPLATAVLQDTSPKSAALYIIPPAAEADYGAALHDLVAGSELASWFWRAGEEPCPQLPAIEGFTAMPVPLIGETAEDTEPAEEA
ncbi:DUF1173 domain-containing protein [Xanthomonas campestris pv. raphani]|uniref:DUF1173 domain-containing protein n=1 Tax=Xanthomonas campestris TaxID=339 RepID=UPI001F3498E5|nr:DUF1173 domain-containing protein [Xanthomonas campestris]MCF8828559.1 DUF1173 domain-containing protein [Xanthomonas campestris pv. raphani]MEA9935286.1 DUF1173 domain-containing protein [Xanthomonas campestris pv. raphani]